MSEVLEPDPVALRFGKKNGDDRDETPAFEPQPDKAHKWFEHARAAAETYNYDYALTCFANGIRLKPDLMSAHEAMYEAAVKYVNGGGKPASGREVKKLEGPHPVDKFAAAEFAWMKDLNNGGLALKCLEAGVAAREWVSEAALAHAPRVLNVLRRQKKPTKSSFIAAKDVMAELGAWNEAIAAGEDAMRLDPRDAQLQNEIKDLSAQRAMDEGRYEEAGGAEGGFRRMARDMDRQRELEDQESIAGGADTAQRNLDRARKEYEASPGIPDAINKYGQLLKAVGTPEALEQAYDVYMKGNDDTGQYRFRASAGDIRIEQAQARVAALRQKLEADGENASLKQDHAEARQALLGLRRSEFEERVHEYPTDRRIRHHLGEVLFELGRYEDAMKCFQEAKDDPKLRVRAAYMLGRSFAAEGWHDIAIQEYEEALDRIEVGDKEAELAIRYDLMVSLVEHARLERSLEQSKRALEICSSIARRDITYRDIRSWRKRVDELMRELSGAAQPES